MRNKVFFITKWIIIPLILICLFFLVSFIFNPNEPFSILTYSQGRGDSITSIGKPLHKGDTVWGTFLAKNDNLGIVLVRFWNFNRISKDVLIFRLKEKGAEGWYYAEQYKVDQFQPNEYFTFGFPIINKSKGKTYEFELISTAGKKGNSVALSRVKPHFATRYKFDLVQNKSNIYAMSNFIYEKTLDFFTDSRSILFSLLYLFPFVYFTLTFLTPENLGKRVFFISLLVCIFSIMIFNKIEILPTLTIFTVFIYWIFGIVRYKLDSSVSFFISLIFLLCMSVSATFINDALIGEKFGIFFYWFLFFGTTERVIEVLRKKSYPRSFKIFMRGLLTE